MKKRKSRWPYLVALMAPGAVLQGVRFLLMAEMQWLWLVYTVVFTLGALLLTWTVWGWREA